MLYPLHGTKKNSGHKFLNKMKISLYPWKHLLLFIRKIAILDKDVNNINDSCKSLHYQYHSMSWSSFSQKNTLIIVPHTSMSFFTKLYKNWYYPNISGLKKYAHLTTNL